MKIAQLTDLHLFADKNGCLLGRDTHAALARVLAGLGKEEGVAAVLLTGDVSQDESEASYRLAAEALAGLGLPVHWIAGNHDKRQTMARVFDEHGFLHPLERTELGGWTFIGVDSCVAGQDGGRIADAELERMRRLLGEADGPAAVVLHHHPLAVGTPLLDDCMLSPAAPFWRIAAASPALKLAICGHAHGDYSLAYRGKALEAGPATCFQWRQGACDIEIDDRHGYRLFDFAADGYSVRTVFV
ncbi:metallophosphoesterase [Chromobacterium phragmitis]|uniref:Metallophosphoesterase n=1 Tax=Chromobacterium phragmitis TaxID=2202141 RepID=A0ABV0IZL5_9NEIS|nr:metallophosphoesterase [Chromobacterium phragmitis]